MNWIEDLLIVLGISLDIFAAMECQGSLVAHIDKRHLSFICLLTAAIQLCALYFGHFLSYLYCLKHPKTDELILGRMIAMLIFMGLGVRLIVKAIRNEHVEEHLERNPGIRRFVRMASVSSIYTIMAGIAFGFLGTNLAVILVMIVVLTVIVAVGGMYTGFRLGMTWRSMVYVMGAVLLFAAAVDVLVRKVL
ncbi:MAG: manganese efflux pump [Lachnospiraceae bacterium]|nr:manganese efflux pump [Lachnospiraceae bacterium]